MAFGIVGISKQKGGSVGSSGHHNDRTRETLNADPERQHLNRVLVGDDNNVREAVDRIIEEHGGKPRRDSVEAVEFLLTASPEWFEEKDPERHREKVERFVGQAVKFLEDPRSGGELAKAVLHMDERTPHVQAHKVPIDPEGKLNAKHYFGGRQKMEALHDLYHEYMEPLGLERGQRGSRATHQTLKRFYGSIEQEVTLEVDRDRVPDPPRVMLTEEARDEYKRKVEKSILKQLLEKFQVIRDQAMLAKDEQARRVETERRAEERVRTVERDAAERVSLVERQAEARVEKVEREGAERFERLRQSASHIIEENRELHREKAALLKSRNEYYEAFMSEQLKVTRFSTQARELGARLSDIPMPEVMEKMGYEAVQRGQAHLYLGETGQVAMRVEQQKAFDSRQQLVARNSLDLVMHMQQQNEGRADFTRTDGVRWLSREFGPDRATAAYLVNGEQHALDWLWREERERGRGGMDRSLAPARDGGPDRSGPDRGGGPDRDTGPSFGR